MSLEDIDREFASLKDYRKSSMYKTKHFKLYELVPKDIYQATPKDKYHRLWQLFDVRGLITLDRLRERYGSARINNWRQDGPDEFGGWRPFDCNTGSELSQHKWGRGYDPKFKHVSADEIREDILKDPEKETFEHITCIEMDIDWLHFDTRNWTRGILKVYPKG